MAADCEAGEVGIAHSGAARYRLVATRAVRRRVALIEPEPRVWRRTWHRLVGRRGGVSAHVPPSLYHGTRVLPWHDPGEARGKVTALGHDPAKPIPQRLEPGVGQLSAPGKVEAGIGGRGHDGESFGCRLDGEGAGDDTVRRKVLELLEKLGHRRASLRADTRAAGRDHDERHDSGAQIGKPTEDTSGRTVKRALGYVFYSRHWFS